MQINIFMFFIYYLPLMYYFIFENLEHTCNK